MLRLVKANIKYENEILKFREEMMVSVNRIPGSAGLEAAESVQQWLAGEYTPHYGKVREAVFLALDEEDRVVGISDIRLESNDFIKQFAGQIGYSVSPSERGKGYATEILKQTVEEARKLGMEHILVTCNESNIASSRVIEKAGGSLESVIPHPGYPNVKRYRFE